MNHFFDFQGINLDKWLIALLIAFIFLIFCNLASAPIWFHFLMFGPAAVVGRALFD